MRTGRSKVPARMYAALPQCRLTSDVDPDLFSPVCTFGVVVTPPTREEREDTTVTRPKKKMKGEEEDEGRARGMVIRTWFLRRNKGEIDGLQVRNKNKKEKTTRETLGRAVGEETKNDEGEGKREKLRARRIVAASLRWLSPPCLYTYAHASGSTVCVRWRVVSH